jgi:leucyl aminopeptidase
VVGLAFKAGKATKSNSPSLQIEAGDLAIDTKGLMQALVD